MSRSVVLGVVLAGLAGCGSVGRQASHEAPGRATYLCHKVAPVIRIDAKR